ncbi:hypothetical protein OPQ81_000387 [Rhizoctonia solani]|nr:hypothetical protein OPQ81_000387 [Rhizoctonia solani]
MSSPIRKPSCLKQCTPEGKRNSSNPGAASGSIGGTSEMLPYAQTSVHFPTAKRDLVKTRPGDVLDGHMNYVPMAGKCIPLPLPVAALPPPCPSLVPDEGSSDDSDGLISPPPERTPPMFSDEDRALAFAASRSKVRRSSREFRRPSYEGFSSPDEGCLGGF